FFLETMWGERNAIYGGPPPWLDEAIVRDTLSAAEIQQLREGFLPAAAPATLQRAIEDADRLLHNVGVLHKAGVRLGLGTDTGGVSGGGAFGLASHVEMELMVKAGLTPAQAIVAATRTTAGILGLDELGTIASGRSADFIVLDANPLESIGNSRKISTVYMQGEEIASHRARKSHD
ncbi:MAG TPA: amidohydrolase family protein, partial [Vicinamibacterales bacterium]|nr:amidohydrolase family protein [Vicinamibacterales bacterium]